MVSNELSLYITEQALKNDEQGIFPGLSFKAIADDGLLACVLPGHTLDYRQPNTQNLLQLLKQVGSADLSVGRVFEGHLNALYLIHLFGTESQQQEWYPSVNDHQQLFGVWNTQAAGGVKIHSLGDGTYRLEGSKTFCSGAANINHPIITGELIGGEQAGWQMVVLPAGKVSEALVDPSFWNPLGMKASVSYRLDFTGIVIEDKDLLGKPDQYYQQPVFSGGAIRFAAVQLGGAEAVFNATKTYLQSLGRTDDLFQRSRMAEMTYLLACGDNWLQAAGLKTDKWLEDGSNTERIVAYANMTRTAIEEICLRVMQLAERSVGARGLMRPGLLERLHRDLTFYLRQPAPDASLIAIGEFVLSQNTSAHELWR